MISNTNKFEKSANFLEIAETLIPLGSHTFSKSRTQLPVGAAPLFASKGEGPYIYDIDSNKLIDFVCSLGAITMGHGDKAVCEAVKRQVDDGVLYSLASQLEYKVAKKIVDLIPCAERVRFGKNGSDATTGCIRLARAFTGRDYVAMCGYHGWQDWSIGTTARNRGVPVATRELTHTFAYNDLANLEQVLSSHRNQFAAVILEPVAFTNPTKDYLQGVKDLAHKHGALLIFDEVVTGFRYKEGSAQARFGVIPDLCSLGKGMANGFPISAVAGRADVMQLMEEVFFSFTMGGELVSLAAANAVLEQIIEDNVLDKIAANGTKLKDGFAVLLEKHQMDAIMSVAGDPSWQLIGFCDVGTMSQWDLKTLWIQECARRGLLSIGVHFIGAAHDESVIDDALAIYDEVFAVMKQAVDKGSVDGLLECEPLTPLFKVR